MPYLTLQGAQVRPILITKDRKQFTRQLFSSNLMQKMKINTSQYNTNSFHIEVTTSAKEAIFSDSQIQMYGIWISQAYLQYISQDPQITNGYIIQIICTGSHSAASGLINLHISDRNEQHTHTYLTHTVTFIHVYVFYCYFSFQSASNITDKFINQHATHNDTSHMYIDDIKPCLGGKMHQWPMAILRVQAKMKENNPHIYQHPSLKCQPRQLHSI